MADHEYSIAEVKAGKNVEFAVNHHTKTQQFTIGPGRYLIIFSGFADSNCHGWVYFNEPGSRVLSFGNAEHAWRGSFSVCKVINVAHAVQIGVHLYSGSLLLNGNPSFLQATRL